MSTIRIGCLLCALSAAAVAGQDGVRAIDGGSYEVPAGARRVIAWTTDGRAFALVRAVGGDATLGIFELTGEGAPRPFVTTASTDAVVDAAIVADRLRPVLHVFWSARPTGGPASVFWQELDVVEQEWRGTPVCLARGTGAEDQYSVNDAEVTSAGAVVIAISCHRRPPQPPWRGNWGSALRILHPGAEEWGELIQVNPAGTGVGASVASGGEIVHVTYRNVSSGCGIYYRAYDVAAAKWLGEGERRISGVDGASTSSNLSSVAVDGTGGLWVAYSAGDGGLGNGRIELAYRAPGRETFEPVVVDADPPRRGGNFSEDGFALATGPGDQVFVLWSKIAEAHRTLYRRGFAGGRAIGPVEVLAEAADGAPGFERIAGARTAHVVGTVLGLASGFGDRAGSATIVVRRWPPRAVAR